MIPDHHPRYVLSSDGFDVYDSWYCFMRVYASPRVLDGAIPGWTKLARDCARSAAARLNLKHDAWLAA